MSVQPRQRLTYEDYAALPDDGIRRQLIDGELIVTPSPNVRHQTLLHRVAFEIETHLRASGGGVVFVAPLDVILSQHDTVQPDVFFIADDRLQAVDELNIKGPPSLVVEVVSDERLDLVHKRDLYARTGVPVYWAVEKDADRISVYRLVGGTYGKPDVVEPGEFVGIEELPGFSLDVADLFRRVVD